MNFNHFPKSFSPNLNLSLTIEFLGNEPLIYITAIKLNT